MNEIKTVGSLCSGTGALDMAVPGELRWVAETNEQAAAVLKREHPDVPNFGDITATDWNYRQHHVDLLTSGDPCQSMSVAGRQLASDDSRFLWPAVMDVIRKTHPLEIFLENVQNIVSVPLVKGGERGGVLRLRIEDLQEAGYDVRWTVLGACAIGAPHHRHRWFLRATYAGWKNASAREVKASVKCGARKGRGRELMPTPNARDGGSRGTPTQEHALRRVANPERSVNLEDAVVAYLLPTPTALSYGNNQGGAAGRVGPVRHSLESLARHELLPTPRATDIGTPGRRSSEGWRPQLGQAVLERWGKFADAIALWEEINGRPAPEPTELAPKGGRRLNPALSEWMMGYPEGYLTRDAGRNEALRMAGNGVVALQARAAWEILA